MVLREAPQRKQNQSVQGIVEIRIDVEADQPGSVIEILLYKDWKAVFAVGKGGNQFVKFIDGINLLQERGGVYSQPVGLEGIGRGGQGPGSGIGSLALQEPYRQALVEIGEVVADADRAQEVFLRGESKRGRCKPGEKKPDV